MTNATSSAALAASDPITVVEPQPSRWLSIRPYTSPARAVLNVTKPAQSGRVAFGFRDSSTRSSVIEQRGNPDRDVDVEDPAPREAGRDRSAEHGADRDGDAGDRTEQPERDAAIRPWNVCASNASDVANMIAPPTPCAPREIDRKSEPVASPQKSEPVVKIMIPIANNSRRP